MRRILHTLGQQSNAETEVMTHAQKIHQKGQFLPIESDVVALRGGPFESVSKSFVSPSSEDERWMLLALEQAELGVGRTAPNPPVGAVIVKNGVLLGKGWHHAAGKPHAEREAIADAIFHFGFAALRGATAYVTLEPCSSHGRTPPCTDGLIEVGITRVVYACVDADPRHAGRADDILRNAGISVTSGVCQPQAELLLAPFFKVRRTGLPWVIWKTAMSLDGRLTRPTGEGPWLTSPESRADVQIWRSKVDAILTSGETVRRDNPALTIRDPQLLTGRPQPWRVVLTRDPDSLPPAATLFTDAWAQRTRVYSGENLSDLLRRVVSEHGVLSAMTECGGSLAAALLKENLVDEVLLYLAPMLCGGPVPALAGSGTMPAQALQKPAFLKIGPDIRIHGLCKSTL